MGSEDGKPSEGAGGCLRLCLIQIYLFVLPLHLCGFIYVSFVPRCVRTRSSSLWTCVSILLSSFSSSFPHFIPNSPTYRLCCPFSSVYLFYLSPSNPPLAKTTAYVNNKISCGSTTSMRKPSGRSLTSLRYRAAQMLLSCSFYVNFILGSKESGPVPTGTAVWIVCFSPSLLRPPARNRCGF